MTYLKKKKLCSSNNAAFYGEQSFHEYVYTVPTVLCSFTHILNNIFFANVLDSLLGNSKT